MLPDFNSLRQPASAIANLRSLEHSSDDCLSYLRLFQKFDKAQSEAAFSKQLFTLALLNTQIIHDSIHTSSCSSPPATVPDSSPTPAYIQEWLDSHVDQSIITANVRYAEADDAVDLLTCRSDRQHGWPRCPVRPPPPSSNCASATTTS